VLNQLHEDGVQCIRSYFDNPNPKVLEVLYPMTDSAFIQLAEMKEGSEPEELQKQLQTVHGLSKGIINSLALRIQRLGKCMHYMNAIINCWIMGTHPKK
jgi:hypothetical protein